MNIPDRVQYNFILLLFYIYVRKNYRVNDSYGMLTGITITISHLLFQLEMISGGKGTESISMHIRIITYFVVKTLIFLYYLTLHIYIFYFLIKLRNTYGRNSIPQSNRKCENIGHLSLLEALDPCLLIRKNVIHRKIVQSSI